MDLFVFFTNSALGIIAAFLLVILMVLSFTAHSSSSTNNNLLGVIFFGLFIWLIWSGISGIYNYVTGNDKTPIEAVKTINIEHNQSINIKLKNVSKKDYDYPPPLYNTNIIAPPKADAIKK